jgi:geranylgeranyl diphosphate synthase type II
MHLRISQVICGQYADLEARDKPIHALLVYEQIAQAKSAPLLALPLDLALIAAGRAGALCEVERATATFAVAYQMADDLEDVAEDAATGEVNIVTILGGASAASPQAAHVREMARERYLAAADLAGRLPEGCGALIAMYAQQGATRLLNNAVLV